MAPPSFSLTTKLPGTLLLKVQALQRLCMDSANVFPFLKLATHLQIGMRESHRLQMWRISRRGSNRSSANSSLRGTLLETLCCHLKYCRWSSRDRQTCQMQRGRKGDMTCPTWRFGAWLVSKRVSPPTNKERRKHDILKLISWSRLFNFMNFITCIFADLHFCKMNKQRSTHKL